MAGRKAAAAAAHQSDEEQEIDIESDDDDIGSPLGKDGYDTNDKKAHHNALERKRRDHIKESFISLRDSLPNVRKEKVSRAQILQQATEYIQQMTRRNNDIRKDIDSMRRQNQELKHKVLMAERTGGAMFLGDSPPHTPIREEEVLEDDVDIGPPPVHHNKRFKSSRQ